MKNKEKSLPLPAFQQPPSILLVIAPFYEQITEMLVSGAASVLNKVNAKVDELIVPGALEIPTAISLASKHYTGFVAIGCVIRGETTHYTSVATESCHALSILGLRGVCIGNGILTVENESQAISRADPRELDKGGEAARAVLYLISAKEKYK